VNPVSRSPRDHPAQAARLVARNTVYLALAEAAGKAMAFFYYLLAARHLGVERYGVLSFALAFTAMLGVLTDLGLGTIATREIARNPKHARPQVDDALTIRLVASVVIIVVIAVLVNVLRYPGTTIRVVYICSVSVLTNAVASLLCNVFQGFERMELVALNRISQTAVLVIGALLLPRSPSVAERYAFLYVVAGVASVVVSGINAAPRLVRPRLSFDVGRWWESLRASTPIGLAAVFTLFYYWSGTTLLSKMSGDSAVGNYSAAFRLTTALVFVGMAFSGAVYPLFSRLSAGGSDRPVRALETATKYMVWLSLPTAAFGAVFARPAVLLLYGGGYQGAVVVLRVLVWWGALASLNSLFSNYLISVRRASAVTIQTAISLAVNVGLAIALIPTLGAVGTATALVASEVVGLACLTATLLRLPGRVHIRPVAVNLLRVALALGLAIVAAREAARLNVALGLAAGLAAYGLLLFAVRAAGKEDLRALWSLLIGTGE